MIVEQRVFEPPRQNQRTQHSYTLRRSGDVKQITKIKIGACPV
jgi:hypothetical protein